MPGKKPDNTGVRVTLKDFTLRDAALKYSEPGLHTELDRFNLDVQALAADTGKKTVTLGAVRSDSAQLALARSKTRGPGQGRSGRCRRAVCRQYRNRGTAGMVAQCRRPQPRRAACHELQSAGTDRAGCVAGARRAHETRTRQRRLSKSGKLAANGTLGLSPLHVDLALTVDKVSLLPLQPYATESVNLRLTQALFSGKGKLALDENARCAHWRLQG
ncbi:DUF748 domain-containing protein [Massilia sp. H-1]|nr:DUF748 domain-containing protein [Massilia sp. H-1]